MKVLVTRSLPREWLQELCGHCQVRLNPRARPFTTEELQTALAETEAVLNVSTSFNSELINAAPCLKMISNFGVGFDNIDLAAATRRGIIVTNLPEAVTTSTAEFTWALLLAVARRLVETDRWVRRRESFAWGPQLLLGTQLYGKRLGLIGLGRIGQAVAARAVAFGMELVYYSRHRQTQAEQTLPVTYLDLPELLASSDIISLHLPLTPQTRHLIAAPQFRLMKPSAILLNLSRGPVVDEQALIAALQSGRIKGAGLDVYEHEPQVPAQLRRLKQVVLAPHLGTATLEARHEMTRQAAQNIIRFSRGEKVLNVVNPEVLKE